MANAQPTAAPPSLSSAGFSNPPLNQILNQLATVKLDRKNYLLWKTLALPILKGYKLEGHLTGETPCPSHFVLSASSSNTTVTEEGADATIGASSSITPRIVNSLFEQWVTTDLLLLGWLYNSMTPDVAIQLMGFTNVEDLWDATQDFFGVQSRAEEDFLRQMLQTTRKGNTKMEEYLLVMKTNVDNLGQVGSPVPRRALISQVLLGLDEVYNLVIVVIQGKPDISWLDMQSKLLIFEKILKHQNTQKKKKKKGNITQSPALNMAQRFALNGQRNHSNKKFYGYNRQHFSGQRGNLNNGPTCQLCGKYGHSALVCYNRFNKEFSSPLVQDRNEHSSNGSVSPNPAVFVSTQNATPFATPDTVVDPNWYIDSGATNHVTRECSNMTNPTEYSGQIYGETLLRGTLRDGFYQLERVGVKIEAGMDSEQ
ncbi:uncharacterized protein E6C27_scaffold19G00360 [Cucumis melo var. makuwa]|uniref:Retrotransposon Copia-like N-terminal domain-containing protein n=1 Tax=Cucumis melo var. makuwa TaxID=1194695 RepID=A0A5A7SIT7_CUCMM|nr:uncharacterized protein E6C27_scaffold19G00360 [Cucumis melo var. makuwa]